MRVLLILHRYLGVVVGLIMTLWCLSGVVMMYQAYPNFSAQERLRALPPLTATGWNLDAAPLSPVDEVESFRIEMLGDCAVLRLSQPESAPRVFDLCSGQPLKQVPLARLTRVANAYGERLGLGPPHSIKPIIIDQWSVGAGAKRHMPVHRVVFGDRARSWIYLSGKTGEVIQDVTARERVLGWLGAVPHWLYPTLLRQNAAVWTQVVIVAASLGVFLTLTGLYVGIARFKRYKSGRWSPYRGWFYWHHLAGLIFGVLTLTWVFSGLMTMNPWGLLDAKPLASRTDYAGTTDWGRVKPMLADAGRLTTAGDVAQLRSNVVAGNVRQLIVRADGAVDRRDARGAPAPLARGEVLAGLRLMNVPLDGDLTLMFAEDSFYYAHHEPVALPVYRAVLKSPDHTRLYIDASSGEMLRVMGAQARANRWIRNGLHGLDFAGLRQRPVWDLVVIPLLLGVTAVCFTGAWMGWLRVRRDLAGLRRRKTGQPRRAP